MSMEAIIKELPKEFVSKMRNWAKTGSCVGLYAITSAYEGMPGNPIFGSRNLADFTEVTHLERALDALANRERLAVMVFWIYEGADLAWLGRRLGCDFRAVERRVRKAHELLLQDLAVREAKYERMLSYHAIAY